VDRLRPASLASYAVADASAGSRAWLDEALSDATALVDLRRLRIAFARAGRLFDDAPLLAEGAPVGWTRRDAVRAALLDAALALARASDAVGLVDALLRRGEIGEQESVLRALPILADPARFVALAIDACRTNAASVFAAVACDNPYPARHFPQHAFNQLVLKAIFLGLPVIRVVGLAERATPELARMVAAYASERRAAGRPVPEDVGLVLQLAQERT